MSTSRSENEMISLALTLAHSVKTQDGYARKEQPQGLTTVTNWPYLLDLSNKIVAANERRLKE